RTAHGMLEWIPETIGERDANALGQLNAIDEDLIETASSFRMQHWTPVAAEGHDRRQLRDRARIRARRTPVLDRTLRQSARLAERFRAHVRNRFDRDDRTGRLVQRARAARTGDQS